MEYDTTVKTNIWNLPVCYNLDRNGLHYLSEVSQREENKYWIISSVVYKERNKGIDSIERWQVWSWLQNWD